MGLDISVFKNAKLVHEGGPTDEEYEDGFIRHIYVIEGFEPRLDGHPAGTYKGEYGDGFRAGSYSGYNHWRGTLAAFSLEVDVDIAEYTMAEAIWRTPEKFAHIAFFELINFADNEGSIGPTTSAKLAKDFASQEAAAKKWAKKNLDEDDREYFLEGYKNFKEAFEAVAGNGFVVFH